MRWTGRGADATALRAWDGILFFWAVFWLVIGAWTGYKIFQLTGLTESTVQSGHALQKAGQALQNLADVPLIGDKTAALGDQVGTTANGIVDSGTQARQSVRGLSVLIGLAIALGPTGPVLLFYLPMRVARNREVRAIKQALNAGTAGPGLQAHLAQRAVANLPFSQLRTVSSDPHSDLAAGRHQDLARAELRRLGLTPAAAARK